MKLPQADWQQSPGLAELIAALDGQARYVGGAVRDGLLGLEVKDVDIATPLLPENVIERLSAVDIKVIPTGIDHGTVTAILPDGPIEITTLRRDVSTDGRRATVAYSHDWKEDAARRDFTINALFADPQTLEIYDYFDGLTAIDQRRVCFIGSADQRIAEDHLRIMRYFRFLAHLERHDEDHEAFEACRKAAPELEKLSRERIADELMKLLATGDPVYAVEKMIAADVFTHIIGGCDQAAISTLARLLEREKSYDVAPSALRRLVAILPKNVDEAVAIAKSLKMSKKLQQAVKHRLDLPLVPVAKSKGASKFTSQQLPTLTDIDAKSIVILAYHHGVETARDIALLFGSDDSLTACLTALDGWEKPDFSLKGGDLITMGMMPGPVVSQALAQIEQAWIEQGFPDDLWVRELAKQTVG